MPRKSTPDVAAIVAAVLAAMEADTPQEDPPAKSSGRAANRKPAKVSAARGKGRGKGRKPFVANPDWKGQEASPRMIGTCARLYADGLITKKQYEGVKSGVVDKFEASALIGKGLAKVG